LFSFDLFGLSLFFPLSNAAYLNLDSLCLMLRKEITSKVGRKGLFVFTFLLFSIRSCPFYDLKYIKAKLQVPYIEISSESCHVVEFLCKCVVLSKFGRKRKVFGTREMEMLLIQHNYN
jgi:hypothetical protein